MEDGNMFLTTGKTRNLKCKKQKFHKKSHQQRKIHSSRWVRIITTARRGSENVIIDCTNFAEYSRPSNNLQVPPIPYVHQPGPDGKF